MLSSLQQARPAPDQKFLEAGTHWNLAKLNADLATAKHQAHSSRRSCSLSDTEQACLRGLLCGYSPIEIATALNRDATGLRVDLSRGLYEYIQLLTGQRPRDWRRVTIVLEKAGYKL
ncbi:MAG: hypothetical protein F6K28_43250 [Microcoleus sp. SIO2G3]|nr:hypothetical protein [Microcoleus sp. SIO2G3]